MGCGICGFVGLSDKELLRRMCDAIRHRGPDDVGYFLDGGVGLGVDRLKIIDLTSGDQPIHNEDGSVWVILNGEIYNYVELRPELEKHGHRFHTVSDTECLVHSYEQWGDRCVEHLRGMFAFVVWDEKARRLFLARDRFGKKPLHYAQLRDVFLFGSEIKSILQWEAVPRQLDHIALDNYFTNMYIPSPRTIFKHVRKLPPGHYAVYDAAGKSLSVRQYWDITFSPDRTATEAAVISTLYSTMMEAVRLRLRSDVPLGAFLSGGIDSSVVVSLMSRLSVQPVKTVSMGFEEGTSEVRYSRLVAEFLKTDHTERIVTPPSAFEILPKLILHFDEPFADHSMMPTFFLSEATRGRVTVALSGDGGDELFMGYSFLNDPACFGVYSMIPNGVRRPLLKSITRLPLSPAARRMANHAYEKDYGNQSPAERYAMRMSTFDTSSLRDLYSESFNREHSVSNAYGYLTGLVESCPASDTLDRLDYATIKGYLSEGILTKVDRMSMAVSLEVRCPLLDHELAEFVGTIPSSFKMRDRETKYIFKKMAVEKKLVPREIAHRKKLGFGAPLESWMRGSWRELTTQALDPVVSEGYTGLFDREKVKHFLSDPSLYSNRLFALTVFISWYRMYIDEQTEFSSTMAGASEVP